VLGSSLTVTPAADVPKRVAKRHQTLVIGNLQQTAMSSLATMNIHAFSDTIMQGIMQRLDIAIPTWIVRRRVRVTCQPLTHNNGCSLLIEARDPDDATIPFSLFHSIRIDSCGQLLKELNHEPFKFDLSNITSDSIDIQLTFFGHYNEIPFHLTYDNIQSIPDRDEFYLFYNPMIGKWRQTTKADDFPLE
jgi:hypothetical protein